MRFEYGIAALLACLGTACGNAADGPSPSRSPASSDIREPSGASDEDASIVRVVVPDDGVAMLRLSDGRASVAGEVSVDKGWDIAFSGWDIHTNGGKSGPGDASAIGPFTNDVFEEGAWPGSPVMFEDDIGGAFRAWYLYDGAGGRVLYSRYHVYGVRDGERLWKVQVLAYYGDVEGAPVSAMYSIRYTALHASGKVGETITVTHLNGTGASLDDAGASRAECLDLGTGARVFFSPEAASASSDWHLCFLRNSITVNGERSGPRGVGAVNLDIAGIDAESLDVVKQRTDETELARFDAVGFGSFANAAFRGDRVVSAFDGRWLDHDVSPPTTHDQTWALLGADGQSRYLLTFAGLEGASEAGPGVVRLRVKAAR